MIKDNGWKKLIGIADVIGADQDILKYLKENEAASGYNLTIIPDIIQFTTTDFQPFLNKIMDAYNSEKPDAIFVTATSLATPSVYKGLRALGVTVPIVGTPTNDSPQVFALGPEAVEGLMFFDVAGMANVSALPDDFPLKEIEMDLLQRFQAKYDAPPTFFAAQGADFIKVVAAVMTTAGGDDKTKVQQAMLTLKDLPGYIGFIGFSPELTSEGVQRPITQWVIKDGKYEFVKVLFKCEFVDPASSPLTSENLPGGRLCRPPGVTVAVAASSPMGETGLIIESNQGRAAGLFKWQS
jgi:ABC-type branched-subunit amino acid transport system substrate-binding protein